MLQKLKEMLKFAAKTGMFLPMAYDVTRDRASVTLLTFYVAMVLTTISLIALHFNTELIVSTSMTLLFLALAFVFYRMRNLDKFKLDLSNRSIELDANEEDVKK